MQPAAGFSAGVGGRASPQDARALFFGAPGPVVQLNALDSEKSRVARRASTQLVDAAGAATRNLGMRYTVLKRLPSGELAPVNPNESREAADEIVLRVEPNDQGYLSIFEHEANGAWRLFSGSRTERMISYDVALEGSGGKELFVVFTRQPQSPPYRVPETPLDQLSSFNQAENATYVASTRTVVQAQTLAFPITLTTK